MKMSLYLRYLSSLGRDCVVTQDLISVTITVRIMTLQTLLHLASFSVCRVRQFKRIPSESGGGRWEW